MSGLYLADLDSTTGKVPALPVSTIERRLSDLAWNVAQRGIPFELK